MAKFKRTVVGSIYKAKTAGEAPYIKLRSDTSQDLVKALAGADSKKGLSLKLESKASRLKSLEDAVSNGKLSEENAGKAREFINKIPDYVQFEIVLLEKN